MAPFGKIYAYQNNVRANRASIIAEINGLEVEIPPFAIGETNRTPEFLAKFPLGKIPAFEGADGFLVTEGMAIDTYIAASGPKADQLLGADPKTKAQITKWMSFAESELLGNLITPVNMALRHVIPVDKQRFDEHLAAFDRAIKCLEVTLNGGKKFLVGDNLTLADIIVTSYMYPAFKHFVDIEWRKEIPNLVGYIEAFAAVPLHRKYSGELEMCETRLQC